MVKLLTERLVIRDNVLGDIDDHHRLMSDGEVMSYIQDIQTHTYEASLENLNFSIAEAAKGHDRQCYFLAITLRATGEYVGSIGFTLLEKGPIGGNAELGYFILKEFWGKGYTSEAAKAVIDFAFDTLKLHKLTTGCNAENLTSENIMIKLGFKKEAHLVKHVVHQGVWKDRVEYGMLNPNLEV